MQNTCVRFLAALLGLTWSGLSFAARPLATEDAGVVEKDAFELEAGLESLRRCGGVREQGLGFVLKAGLAYRLDLGIETPYSFEPESGWDSASLSVKYALLPEAKVPASLYFSHCLGGSGYTLVAISSVRAAAAFLHLNLGFEAEGLAGGGAAVCYAGALEYPVAESAFLVGEVVGRERELTSLLGARLRVAERMNLDLGFGFGVAETDSRESVAAGLTLVL